MVDKRLQFIEECKKATALRRGLPIACMEVVQVVRKSDRQARKLTGRCLGAARFQQGDGWPRGGRAAVATNVLSPALMKSLFLLAWLPGLALSAWGQVAGGSAYVGTNTCEEDRKSVV